MIEEGEGVERLKVRENTRVEKNLVGGSGEEWVKDGNSEMEQINEDRRAGGWRKKDISKKRRRGRVLVKRLRKNYEHTYGGGVKVCQGGGVER